MPRKAMRQEELKEKHEKHFFEAINGQSPLACALIATAFIENALVTLLSKFLVDCETAKGMFRAGGPLGDLAKCADMAYCLGFINKGMLENIKRIGNIRNTFAHSPEFLDFTHPSLKDDLAKLTYPKASGTPVEQITGNNPRNKFSLISMSLYTWIFFAVISVERREKNGLDHLWPASQNSP